LIKGVAREGRGAGGPGLAGFSDTAFNKLKNVEGSIWIVR